MQTLKKKKKTTFQEQKDSYLIRCPVERIIRTAIGLT